MIVVDVLDISGDKISQVSLNESIFDVSIKKSVLHQVVVAQQNAKRAGTVGVKGRSDVIGSNRKLYRQKGTGRARKGNIKSPLLRGGGVVFGPVARSYEKKVLKKVRRLAIKMALSSKLRTNDIIVVNDFCLDNIKTKYFINVIKKLKAQNSLIVTHEFNNSLWLSSRNVPGIKVMTYQGINVLDILKYTKLIILEPSLEKIEGRLL